MEHKYDYPTAKIYVFDRQDIVTASGNPEWGGEAKANDRNWDERPWEVQ